MYESVVNMPPRTCWVNDKVVENIDVHMKEDEYNIAFEEHEVISCHQRPPTRTVNINNNNMTSDVNFTLLNLPNYFQSSKLYLQSPAQSPAQHHSQGPSTQMDSFEWEGEEPQTWEEAKDDIKKAVYNQVQRLLKHGDEFLSNNMSDEEVNTSDRFKIFKFRVINVT